MSAKAGIGLIRALQAGRVFAEKSPSRTLTRAVHAPLARAIPLTVLGGTKHDVNGAGWPIPRSLSPCGEFSATGGLSRDGDFNPDRPPDRLPG